MSRSSGLAFVEAGGFHFTQHGIQLIELYLLHVHVAQKVARIGCARRCSTQHVPTADDGHLNGAMTLFSIDVPGLDGVRYPGCPHSAGA